MKYTLPIRKDVAVKLLGGTQKAVADKLGLTLRAIYNWGPPNTTLSRGVALKVIGASVLLEQEKAKKAKKAAADV